MDGPFGEFIDYTQKQYRDQYRRTQNRQHL